MYQRLVKFLSAAAVILAIAPIAPAKCGGWELVFSDDFDGGQLDKNKWATRFIYNNETLDHFNDEIQRYRDTQIQLSDGILNLVAEKKPGSNNFESGLIRSHRTFYYGYYEARVILDKFAREASPLLTTLQNKVDRLVPGPWPLVSNHKPHDDE